MMAIYDRHMCNVYIVCISITLQTATKYERIGELINLGIWTRWPPIYRDVILNWVAGRSAYIVLFETFIFA